jgi:hypothetical protein
MELEVETELHPDLNLPPVQLGSPSDPMPVIVEAAAAPTKKRSRESDSEGDSDTCSERRQRKRARDAKHARIAREKKKVWAQSMKDKVRDLEAAVESNKSREAALMGTIVALQKEIAELRRVPLEWHKGGQVKVFHKH